MERLPPPEPGRRPLIDVYGEPIKTLADVSELWKYMVEFKETNPDYIPVFRLGAE